MRTSRHGNLQAPDWKMNAVGRWRDLFYDDGDDDDDDDDEWWLWWWWWWRWRRRGSCCCCWDNCVKWQIGGVVIEDQKDKPRLRGPKRVKIAKWLNGFKITIKFVIVIIPGWCHTIVLMADYYVCNNNCHCHMIRMVSHEICWWWCYDAYNHNIQDGFAQLWLRVDGCWSHGEAS